MHRFIFVLAVLVAVVQAQKIGFGGCPAVNPKTSFAASSFQGLWFVYSKDHTRAEGADNCYVGAYFFNATGVSFEKHILAKNGSLVESIPATGAYKQDSTVGAFDLVFPNGQAPGPVPYYVIDTDYKYWAVTYICVDYGIIHFDVLYILRRLYVDIASNPAPFAAIDAQNLDRSQMKIADEGCRHLA